MSEGSQHYIGIANGVVICVDDIGNDAIIGRYYHGYQTTAGAFTSITDLLFQMERLFDYLHFPFPATSNRSFRSRIESYNNEERTRVMTDKELLEKHGDLGTFIVRVQHRQNSSWQGRITWVEENKTVNFRSVWEMMKLIDGALDEFKDEEDLKQPKWE